MRGTLPFLLVLALGGCRTSEALTGDRTSSDEPALAVVSEPAAAEEAPAGESAGAEAITDASGEGKAAVDEPAGAEPDDGKPGGEAAHAEPIDPSPAPSDPSAATAPSIQTFFASDSDEALADARFTARKLPKRAEEIRGLLDVRPLLGQPVLASARSTADVIATITPEGLVTPTDACPWVIFQHELEWTKGRIRCGDVFLREPDSGEGHEEMVPVLETVTIKGARYSRIIVTNEGRTGWVKTESVPRKLSKVLAKYAAGGSRTWDRMLYAEPGTSPVKLEFRGAIALKIEETRKVDGRTWLRVVARVDQCLESSRRKLGEGWLPQHAEDGSLNVYYELSC